MDTFSDSTLNNEVRTLREGIRNKYKEYKLLDRDRFPDIEYNTNRVNYEPVRQSFEEEFYVVRGIDRTENNLHIPSTKTLALIFSDDGYVPGKKILNTCRSYAEGKPAVSAELAFPFLTQLKKQRYSMTIAGVMAGVVAVTAVVIYTILRQPNPSIPPQWINYNPAKLGQDRSS